MDQELSDVTINEVVGIFGKMQDLQAAVDELYAAGFNQSEVSMLAEEEAVKKQLGEKYQKVDEIADDPKAPRVPYFANENIGAAQGGLIGGLLYVGTLAVANIVIAAGGSLATVLTASAFAGGASTAVGMILGKIVGTHHAEYLEKQLKHGGLLLWVNTQDAEKERKAQQILIKHSARDVHTHSIPANLYISKTEALA